MAAPEATRTDDRRWRAARGPRAAERLLLERLREILPAGRAPDLARPVLVLVPSGSLRRQLLRRIAQRLGPALLGLEVVLPRTLAARIVARGGEPARPDGELHDLLVRRAAAEEEMLETELGRYEDGFGLVGATVRDLASAGAAELDDAAAAELADRLPAGTAGDRARAILRVTRVVAGRMRELGAERSADLMARAARLLEERGAALLGAGAILIHGFADAPGASRRFLRALLSRLDAEIVLDLPPDPSDPGREAPQARFARRFAAALGLAIDDRVDAVLRPARCRYVDAVGREAEVAEAAWRIAAEIESGIAPEGIGIVVRDQAAYAPEIRRRFRMLGIPCSGTALDAAFDPRSASARDFGRLVARGEDLDLDRFIGLCGRDFLAPAAGAGRHRELLLACRSLGLADLGALAALDVDRALQGDSSLELPLGVGLEGEGEGERARKKRLPAELLRRAVARASALLLFLGSRPERARLAAWADDLARGATRHLGLADDERPPFLRLLRELGQSGSALEIDRAEFELLFTKAAAESFSPRLGGQGLGVQVLGLAQARGLVFERLHVLGLNARVFPRLGREDPLLGDELREVLRERLPDLGRHRDRAEEESYLFAQLMEAGAEVSLSWLRADDEGKETARSPFVERLRLKDDAEEDDLVSVARILEDRLGSALARGRALGERDRQLLAALTDREGERRELRAAEIALHLAEMDPALRAGAPDPALVARAQGELRAELDLASFDPEAGTRLSPFMGRIGPDSMLSAAPLWITALEATARCPWQAFLGRILRLEAVTDPVTAPPAIDALLLGNTVHRALETLIAPGPGPLERPAGSAIEDAVAAAARREARAAGVDLAGLVAVLAGLARLQVERAIALDWREGSGPRVKAVECRAELELETARGPRTLRFRADRLDEDDDGEIATDYKTGKPPSTAKKAATRRKHVLEGILEGRLLQGAAYALVFGRGRYRHLDPELDDELASFEITADDETRQRFALATRPLERAWAEGLMPPRLENEKGQEPTACQYCDFRSACIRGDSGARRRLAAVVTAGLAREDSLLADLYLPKLRLGALVEEEPS